MKKSRLKDSGVLAAENNSVIIALIKENSELKAAIQEVVDGCRSSMWGGQPYPLNLNKLKALVEKPESNK